MQAAAAAQEFEQAALERNRLRAVRSLLERQRVANESIGTLDAVAVAVDGTDANAQVFQVRDGVLSDRQSFYLANEAERDRRPRWPRSSCCSTTSGPPRSRRRSSSQRELGRAGAALAEALAAPPRRPGRGARAPSAATSGGSSSSPSATRALALEQEQLQVERGGASAAPRRSTGLQRGARR